MKKMWVKGSECPPILKEEVKGENNNLLIHKKDDLKINKLSTYFEVEKIEK
jgi:hypothetical protein